MNTLLFTVSSGSGPVEVRLFVRMLAEMLARELSQRGAAVEHVTPHGPIDQPSSVDLVVLGNREFMTDWLGTHALVSRSDRRNKRDRKRWYAAITCAERRSERAVEIDMRDVTFETCRAGGAGGQHVNKTESAVRAVHRPSGLSVRIESERSQHQNKRRATEELTSMLSKQNAARVAQASSARRARSIQVERGRPVATWHCVKGVLVRADKVEKLYAQ